MDKDLLTAIRASTFLVKDYDSRTCCAIVRAGGAETLPAAIRKAIRNGGKVQALVDGSSLAALAADGLDVDCYAHGSGDGERNAYRAMLDTAQDALEQRVIIYAHRSNYQNMRKLRACAGSERGAMRDYMRSLRNGV